MHLQPFPRSLAIVSTAILGLAASACGGSVNSGTSGQQAGDGGTGAEGGSSGGSSSSSGGADGGSGSSSGGSIPDAGYLEAVQLYSCLPSSYTATVTIGTSQSFQMTIDTGSTTLGVASSSCSGCGVSPSYAPGSTATDQHQQTNAQYGSGSWSGEVYQDTVAVGPSASTPVKFAAIDSQQNFFVPAECGGPGGSFQGILGLGPPQAISPGTQGFFDALVANKGVANIFSTQLCDTGGTLWLGGYDPSAMTAAPQYTPELGFAESFYYAVNLASITVNGTSTPITSGQNEVSVVDTGTSVFILPTAAFGPITQAIASAPGFSKVFGSAGASWFSSSCQAQPSCSPLSQTKAELDATLPPMTLVLGSNPSISVQAVATESYLISYEGQWCQAICAYDIGQGAASIMGAPVLRSNVVVFDRQNNRIGFAPHKPCQ